MNGSSNDSVSDKSSIGETITTALLAAPLTIFLVLMLDTFPDTRWLASVMGMGGPDPDVPVPEEQAVEPSERTSVIPE